MGSFLNANYFFDEKTENVIVFEIVDQFVLDGEIYVYTADKKLAEVTNYKVEDGVCYITINTYSEGVSTITLEAEGHREGTEEIETFTYTVNMFIDADSSLFELFKDVTREGITIAAPGFYAPQGRWLRLQPADPELNKKIEEFNYNGRRITNFEMESSALAGLAALMGHRACTICTIIAQRIALDACTDYKPYVKAMIHNALDRLATL